MQSGTRLFTLNRRAFLGASAALALPGTGWAQTSSEKHLRFGVAVLPTSCDPHFHALDANIGPLAQIYDYLVNQDETGELRPQLAESWQTINDNLWEFTLRKNVVFHNGSPFTAADVIASFERVPNVENSPGSFNIHLGAIAGIKAVDDHTIHIETRQPAAFLLRQICHISIISKEFAKSPTADFNSGVAAIGTGPYRLSSYVPGDVFRCEAFEKWWGGDVPWQAVTMRQIPADAARASALLAGDVDIIEQVPYASLEALRRESAIDIAVSPPSHSHYIALDVEREESPFARGPKGENPLRDVRVRRALSLSIDRKALVDRMLNGNGEPLAQYASSWNEGSDAAIGAPKFDPEAARALLAEAGYESGLSLTLHGTSGWLPQDQILLQAIVQFWRRVGIEANLETLPVATYLPRATRREFSMIYGATGGTYAALHLRQLIMSRDLERGQGTVNRLLYSNPEVDEAISEAYVTLDLDARNQLLSKAIRTALEDCVQIPVLSSSSLYAMRRDVTSYRPSGSLRTSALYADPVGS